MGGDLRSDLDPFAAEMNFWGALSGLILLADSKQACFARRLGLPKEGFWEQGFQMLYHAIENKEKSHE